MKHTVSRRFLCAFLCPRIYVSLILVLWFALFLCVLAGENGDRHRSGAGTDSSSLPDGPEPLAGTGLRGCTNSSPRDVNQVSSGATVAPRRGKITNVRTR